MSLGKLAGIRGDLVRTDTEWETWDFAKLSDALRLWARRNPITECKDEDQVINHRGREKSRKLIQAKGSDHTRRRGCVYCEGEQKATGCEKVTDVGKRK